MLQARRATESMRPEQARDRLLASLGLGFNPFSIAINQDSYYETAATRRIMELIVYGAETRKGFLLLSGEAWSRPWWSIPCWTSGNYWKASVRISA